MSQTRNNLNSDELARENLNVHIFHPQICDLHNLHSDGNITAGIRPDCVQWFVTDMIYKKQQCLFFTLQCLNNTIVIKTNVHLSQTQVTFVGHLFQTLQLHCSQRLNLNHLAFQSLNIHDDGSSKHSPSTLNQISTSYCFHLIDNLTVRLLVVITWSITLLLDYLSSSLGR